MTATAPIPPEGYVWCPQCQMYITTDTGVHDGVIPGEGRIMGPHVAVVLP